MTATRSASAIPAPSFFPRPRPLPRRSLGRRLARRSPAIALGLTLAACGGSGGAPGGAALFAKSFGGPGFDDIAAAVETPDGGFAFVGGVAGLTSGEGVADSQAWITKLDPFGDVEWSEALGQQLHGEAGLSGESLEARAAIQRTGGGFYVASQRVANLGSDGSFTTADVELTRLDSDGGDVWTRTYEVGPPPGEVLEAGEPGTFDSVRAVVATPDGGALLAGRLGAKLAGESLEDTQKAPWIMKVDEAGTVQWRRFLDPQLGSDGFIQFGPYVASAADGTIWSVLTLLDVGFASVSRYSILERRTPGGDLIWSERIDDLNVDGLSLAESSLISAAAIVWGLAPGDFGHPETTAIVVRDDQVQEFRVPLDLARVGCATGLIGAGRYVFIGDPLPGTFIGQLALALDIDGSVSQTAMLNLASSWTLRALQSSFPEVQGLASFKAAEFPVSEPVMKLRGPLTQPEVALLPEQLVMSTQMPESAKPWVQRMGWEDASTRFWKWAPGPSGAPGSEVLSVHDENGNEAWSRAFGSAEVGIVERAIDVELLIEPGAPGGWKLAVLGSTERTVDDALEATAWLATVAPDGSLLSEVLLEGAVPLADRPAIDVLTAESDWRLATRSLVRAADGGLLAHLDFAGAARVAKFGSDGSSQWCSGGLFEAVGFPDGVSSLVALEDGGAVAASGTGLARVGADGTVLWRKHNGGGRIAGLAVGQAGTLCIARLDDRLEFEGIDLAGNWLWRRAVGDAHARLAAFGAPLVATEDGGFAALLTRALAISSSVVSPDPEGEPVQTAMFELLRVESDGTPRWSTVFGGLAHELPSSLRTTADGGFLLAGRSASITESVDGWLLRVDSCGRVAVGCPAEFEHTPEGIAHDPFAGSGPVALGDGAIAPELTAAVPLATAPATSTIDSVADLLVTRQCSGNSKDEPQLPTGPQFTLTLQITSGAGTVTVVAPEGPQTCTSNCSFDLPADAVIDLFATPAPGYEDAVWVGTNCDLTPGPTCSVTMDQDRTVSVVFMEDEGGYMGLSDLSVVFSGDGSGRVLVSPPNLNLTGSGVLEDTYGSGDTVTLTATADPGSSFGAFTGADSVDGNVAQVVFGESDRVVYVTFQ